MEEREKIGYELRRLERMGIISSLGVVERRTDSTSLKWTSDWRHSTKWG